MLLSRQSCSAEDGEPTQPGGGESQAQPHSQERKEEGSPIPCLWLPCPSLLELPLFPFLGGKRRKVKEGLS